MAVTTSTEPLRAAAEHHGQYEPTAPPHHRSGLAQPGRDRSGAPLPARPLRSRGRRPGGWAAAARWSARARPRVARPAQAVLQGASDDAGRRLAMTGVLSLSAPPAG